MSELRKVVDKTDARRCLSALAKSGTTLREWARANGVDGRSLRAWQINLSRGSQRAAPTSTPARVVELVATPRPAPRCVVHVGPGAVEVDDDFDACTLRRIVEVLRSC